MFPARSASLRITVNSAVAPPSSLAYPQTSVTATAGQSIIPNIPSFTGTVTAFTVNPALPAGVSLDLSTGAIAGTPTAQTAQASYTIAASNEGGSTTAAITFAVNKQYTTVLELGHASPVTLMRSTTDRLLSQDNNKHWALWDTNSDTELASGDSMLSTSVDMAGTTIAVGLRNGLEVRSSVDGHVFSVIAAPRMINPDPAIYSGKAWWKLASDGSYLAAGSSTGLAVWSTAGQQILLRREITPLPMYLQPLDRFRLHWARRGRMSLRHSTPLLVRLLWDLCFPERSIRGLSTGIAT